MNLRNAKIIVTGGASGLGLAVVNEFVHHNARVAILDINTNESIVNHENMLFIKTDVSSESEINTAIQQVTKEFGGITGLINCAGIASSQRVIGRDNLHKTNEFTRTIGVNLTGTFLCCREAANAMQNNNPNKDNERGVIINTASIAAFDGQIGQAAYAASKGGIVSLTLPLAREFARFGVRVMAIAPGLFDTPIFENLPEESKQHLCELTPFPKRLGNPREFAILVRHIYENPMLNGETIRLDGALRMPPK